MSSDTATLINQDQLEEEIIFCGRKEIENVSLKEYFHEIIESCSKLIAFFYVIVIFIFFISFNATAFDILLYTNQLLDVSVITKDVFNIFIFVIAIINFKLTKKYRGDIVRNEKRNLFFKFIFVPICVWSCLQIIIFTIQIHLGQICVFRTFSKYLYVTEMLLIISGLMTVYINMKVSMDQVSKLVKSFHRFTISLLVMASLHLFILDITIRSDYSFIKYFDLYFNVTFKFYQQCNRTLFKITILEYTFIDYILALGPPLFAGFLILFLLTEVKELQEYFPNRNNIVICISYYIRVVSILLCALIPLIIFIILSIIYSHSFDLEAFLIIIAVKSILCISGIIIIKFKLKKVLNWPRLESHLSVKSMFDKYIIWIGCLTQLIAMVSDIEYAVFQLVDFWNLGYQEHILLIVLLFMILFSSILVIIHVIFQSYLIEISIERKFPESSEVDIISKKICPSLLLIGINLSCFIICVYEYTLKMQFLITNDMVIKLFLYNIQYISQAMRLVLYLHGAIYFYLLAKFSEFNVMGTM